MITLTLGVGPRLLVLGVHVLFCLVHAHDVGCAEVLAKRQGPSVAILAQVDHRRCLDNGRFVSQ